MVGAVLAVIGLLLQQPMPTMAQFEPQYCHTKSEVYFEEW